MRYSVGGMLICIAFTSLLVGIGAFTGFTPFETGAAAGFVLVFVLIVYTLSSTGAAEPTGPDKDEDTETQNALRKSDRFAGKVLLGAWAVLMVVAYLIDRAAPDEALVANLSSWEYEQILSPGGLAGPGIRAEIARFMAALPPEAAWNTRALTALACGVVGFFAFGMLVRLLTNWRWAAIGFLAWVFSIGAYHSGRASVFVDPPHMTCEDYRRGAAANEFLTTGDINALGMMRCRLPTGFRMDRATPERS